MTRYLYALSACATTAAAGTALAGFPVSFTLAHDLDQESFSGLCDICKRLRVTQINLPAAPLGTPFNSEIDRLKDGIGDDELARCKARAKSSLIMQQESSSARAASLVGDWYHLRRVTTLEELHRRIDGLSVRGILDHLRDFPVRNTTILTLGPAPLEVRS